MNLSKAKRSVSFVGVAAVMVGCKQSGKLRKNHQMKVYGKRRGCTQIGLVKCHLVWRRIMLAGDIFGVV